MIFSPADLKGRSIKITRSCSPPEKGQRRLHNAADILAPSIMTEMHAEWRVEDMIDGQPVEPAYNRLLLVQARRVIPRCDLGFDLRIIRPTIRHLIAVGAK